MSRTYSRSRNVQSQVPKARDVKEAHQTARRGKEAPTKMCGEKTRAGSRQTRLAKRHSTPKGVRAEAQNAPELLNNKRIMPE